jgi:hypothetical protein
MKPEDFKEFEKALNNRHTEDSFPILKSETNGQPDDEGNTDVMSLRFTYAESPEDLSKRKFKQIKFWMYKQEAAEIGEIMYKTATARRRLN